MKNRSSFFVFLFVFTLSFPDFSADTSIDLLAVEKGDLPFVFTAPHGGERDIPGGKEKPKGAKVRDVNIELLAKKTSEALEKRLDARPYSVIAQFSRRYVDANRGPDFDMDQAYG